MKKNITFVLCVATMWVWMWFGLGLFLGCGNEGDEVQPQPQANQAEEQGEGAEAPGQEGGQEGGEGENQQEPECRLSSDCPDNYSCSGTGRCVEMTINPTPAEGGEGGEGEEGGEGGEIPPDCIPSPEVCDGHDNDCDGVVDEGPICDGAGQSCVQGICTCATGVFPDECAGVCTDLNTDRRNCGECGQACLDGQTCQSGQCRGCTPSNGSVEICDGKDNDCDGEVDEELVRSCQDVNGASGTQICQNGEWSTCASAPICSYSGYRLQYIFSLLGCPESAFVFLRSCGGDTLKTDYYYYPVNCPVSLTFNAQLPESIDCFQVEVMRSVDGNSYTEGDRWACNFWNGTGRVDGELHLYECVNGQEVEVIVVVKNVSGGGNCMVQQ